MTVPAKRPQTQSIRRSAARYEGKAGSRTPRWPPASRPPVANRPGVGPPEHLAVRYPRWGLV